MPMSDWIENATLIPEGEGYKVDASGHIIIPSYMRNKFKIDIGDTVDFYTTFAGGKWFLCVTASPDRPSIHKEQEVVSDSE